MKPQSSLGDRAVAIAAVIAVLVSVLFGAAPEPTPRLGIADVAQHTER
jgi:hypothetical protein